MKTNFKISIVLGLTVLATACALKPFRLPGEGYWPPRPAAPRIMYVEGFLGSPYFVPRFSEGFINAILGGAKADRMFKPVGVVADDKGNLYVSDGPGLVMMLDRENETVREIANQGQGKVMGVAGLAFHNGRRELYVCDTERRAVLVIDPSRNELLRQYSEGFSRPVALAIDELKDRLAVVDSAQHRVRVISAKTGAPIFNIGRRGTKEGEFNYPMAAAWGKGGKLYVTDAMNFRIQVFDEDGKFISTFGSLGVGSGQFSRPKGIGVDTDGHVYVVDAAFSNVQVFDGESGEMLLAFGQGGLGPGEFRLPHGLFVDKSNRIYVVDQINRRVQVFQYLNESDSKRVARDRDQAASEKEEKGK